MARCSFCGSPHESARRLILGKSVAICADCVRACMKMLEEDDGGVVAAEGQIVVRFLDGTVLACEARSEWHPFDYDGYALEWCAAFAPPPTQSPLVAVRASNGTRIVGATVGDEPITEIAARMVVEAQGGPRRCVRFDGIPLAALSRANDRSEGLRDRA